MPNPAKWLIYGANGYTARLIAGEVRRRGLQPVLAGRNRVALDEMAGRWGAPVEVFELNSADEAARHLTGVAAVLNCAGPFSRTAHVMMDACMIAGAHYLDITGEIDVIEAAAARDQRAKAAGVALLPAVGFDVVPTDCLAAMLAQHLPGATTLELAFTSTGGLSRGTAKTMLESFPSGGRARTGGQIVRVPVAWKSMRVPFRSGSKWAMTIPWGDVASAYYSTGIGNIEVYAAAPRRQIAWLRRLRFLLPLFKLYPVRLVAEKIIDRKIAGPTDEQRAAARSNIWGRVTRGDGQSASATLVTPSGYELTMLTATAAMERVLAGDIATGFHTPSQAFGKDFILEMPDTDFRWESDRGGASG